jgi:hypothetical protein
MINVFKAAGDQAESKLGSRRKRILNSRNSCNHSVLNCLSSHLLSKNLEIKIYKTMILPAVLCEYETWSLAVKEGLTLRVYEDSADEKVWV